MVNSFWDRLGISASLLCAIHCMVTPILVLSSPLIGRVLNNQAFHLIVALIVFPIALYALWSGYRLHRYPQMLGLGIVGLLLMVAGIWAEAQNNSHLEIGLMVTAGLFLVAAHSFNMRACRITTVPGQPPRPHDHSSGAKADHTKPDIQAHENV